MMIKSRLGVWEPGGEEASGVWLHVVDGRGMSIGKDIDLSVWAEVGELGVVVLVAFDMTQFDFDR
jgi:hypothetical protein